MNQIKEALVKFIKFFPLLIPVLLTLAYGMNDTEGVIGKGLFPLGEGSKNLVILSEKIFVILMKDGTKVIRRYEIKNAGESGKYELGTILCYNCLSESEKSYTKVRIGSQQVKLNKRLSYLIDEGSTVKVVKRSKKEIKKLLEGIDGTIESHVWGTFNTDFKSGEVKYIELETAEPLVTTYFMLYAVSNLYLYTEKFFGDTVVPFIEVRFTSQNNMIPMVYFKPEGSYTQESVIPDSVGSKALVWQFTNYKPTKKMYSYTYKLLHPYAVKGDLIRKAFTEATGIEVKY